MRNGVILAVIVALAWHFLGPLASDGGYAEALPPAPQERAGPGVTTVQFTDLFAARRSFGDLALPGHYTVVEVYLDSCAICRRLETSFPAFLKARRDVVVRKVHFPEGGMQFDLQGTTREEIERSGAEMNARIKAYQVCGTPHIEVYDPQGQVLARDECGKKRGLAYLRGWIGSELGRPASSI